MDARTNAQSQKGFAVASFVCGLIALLTACTGVLSVISGSLGVLFALLARRQGQLPERMASNGILYSSVGMALGIALTVYSLASLPTMLQDPEYRYRLDTTFERVYGMDFEEFLNYYYGNP